MRSERCYLRPRGRPLVLRVKTKRGSDEPTSDVNEWIGANGEEVGEVFRFVYRDNVSPFLATIRRVVPLHVIDCRTP
jgi:hypothetical protein